MAQIKIQTPRESQEKRFTRKITKGKKKEKDNVMVLNKVASESKKA